MMKMNNYNEGVLRAADWTKMPTELLEQICKRVTISDQARFISVCKNWLSANTSKKAFYWIPDAPWLVSNKRSSAQFQVISTTDEQTYNMYKPFNPLRNAYIIGSSKGWLILTSDQNLFILNLFSRVRLDLPPIVTMCLQCSKRLACFGMHKPIAFTISMCSNMNPTSVAVVTQRGDLGWCKVGDTTWKGYHTATGDDFYTNVVYHDNKLYAVVQNGSKVDMFTYDEGVLIQVGSVKPPRLFEDMPDPFRPIRCMSVYLVECGGKVLIVKRFYDDTKFHKPTTKFDIYMVEEDEFVKVDSLYDHVLFVANLNIECLDAKYCPKFEPGSVYFTCNSGVVKVFTIANRTVQKVPLIKRQSPGQIWMMPRSSFECECQVCASAPWFRPRELKKRILVRKTNIA